MSAAAVRRGGAGPTRKRRNDAVLQREYEDYRREVAEKEPAALTTDELRWRDAEYPRKGMPRRSPEDASEPRSGDSSMDESAAAESSEGEEKTGHSARLIKLFIQGNMAEMNRAVEQHRKSGIYDHKHNYYKYTRCTDRVPRVVCVTWPLFPVAKARVCLRQGSQLSVNAESHATKAQEEASATPAGVMNVNEDSDDPDAYTGEQKEIAQEMDELRGASQWISHNQKEWDARAGEAQTHHTCGHERTTRVPRA